MKNRTSPENATVHCVFRSLDCLALGADGLRNRGVGISSPRVSDYDPLTLTLSPAPSRPDDLFLKAEQGAMGKWL